MVSNINLHPYNAGVYAASRRIRPAPADAAVSLQCKGHAAVVASCGCRYDADDGKGGGSELTLACKHPGVTL